MNAAQQIAAAATLGANAFHSGKGSAPALCADLLNMIAGREIGATPKGEASTVAIMKAYAKAWHAANIAATVSP